LNPETFARLRLSFIVIVDREGEALFAKSLAAAGDTLEDAPPDLVALATADGRLGVRENGSRKLTGLIAGEAGVFLVSSQPIMHPSQDLSAAGRLVMGRSLSEVIAPSLARVTGQSLLIERELVASRPVDQAQGRDTLSVQGDEIDAVTPLDDIWGQEIAQLH